MPFEPKVTMQSRPLPPPPAIDAGVKQWIYRALRNVHAELAEQSRAIREIQEYLKTSP